VWAYFDVYRGWALSPLVGHGHHFLSHNCLPTLYDLDIRVELFEQFTIRITNEYFWRVSECSPIANSTFLVE